MTDIIGGTNDSYVVIGFFTPDYRPLAARLADDLSKFDIPHHLYATTAAEWHAATLLKPAREVGLPRKDNRQHGRRL
ncbi:hypothetical protein [Hyphomicrobium facile]|uniref:Uncharacterized protein n=1 Tax=Hyphomicrobium facile TaxID=51670 RepID=A0A1I7NU29_9HYPH|nr:hypothetical protein [Hyphomicrobium facile]SFV38123.1 hypothetical protein SAMN04488557_3526 [Hyphomicrobium facile]